MRSPGTERFELTETQEGLTNQLRLLFNRIGMSHRLKPKRNHYGYSFIFGSDFQDFKNRFDYIRFLWDTGIRFKTLVFLTAERSLDAHEVADILEHALESTWRPMQPPNTEAEMTKMVYQHFWLAERI